MQTENNVSKNKPDLPKRSGCSIDEDVSQEKKKIPYSY